MKTRTNKKAIFKTDSQNLGLYNLTTYHGDLDSDSFLYPVDEESKINDNYACYHFQNDKYMKYLCKVINSQICPRLIETFADVNLKLGKVTCENYDSPKEYNFGGDCFNLDFEITPTFLNRCLVFINANYSELNTYLYKHYSSRDGFISFTANNCPDLVDSIKGLIKYIKEGKNEFQSRGLSALFSFILDSEGFDSTIEGGDSQMIENFVDFTQYDSFVSDFENGYFVSNSYAGIDSELEEKIILNLIENDSEIGVDGLFSFIQAKYSYPIELVNEMLQEKTNSDYDFTKLIQRTFAEIDSNTMEITFN